jgi:hypothetical protein
MQVRFAGKRLHSGKTLVDIVFDAVPRPRPLYLAMARHWPTGLGWGCPGSGPTQLAWVKGVELVTADFRGDAAIDAVTTAGSHPNRWLRTRTAA